MCSEDQCDISGAVQVQSLSEVQWFGLALRILGPSPSKVWGKRTFSPKLFRRFGPGAVGINRTEPNPGWIGLVL